MFCNSPPQLCATVWLRSILLWASEYAHTIQGICPSKLLNSDEEQHAHENGEKDFKNGDAAKKNNKFLFFVFALRAVSGQYSK